MSDELARLLCRVQAHPPLSPVQRGEAARLIARLAGEIGSAAARWEAVPDDG